MDIQTESLAQTFMQLLKERLLQADRILTNDQLRERFRSGISSLPDGEIKKQLQENFNSLAEELCRLFHQDNQERLQLQLQARILKGKEYETIVDLIMRGLKDNESKENYLLGLFESDINSEAISLVVSSLAQIYKETYEDSMDATAKLLTTTINRLYTMEDIQDFLPIMAALLKEVIVESTEYLTKAFSPQTLEHMEELRSKLSKFITLIHFKFGNYIKYDADTTIRIKYLDIISAYLSLYIDLDICTSSKNYDGNNQQLSVTALNFTLRTISCCPEFLFDVILQSTVVDKRKLLPLIKQAILLKPDLQDCTAYVKYICVHRLGRTFEKEILDIKKYVSAVIDAPTNFHDWLSHKDKQLLETIFIKKTWTRSKVSDYLLHNMPEDVTEQLLNLAVEEEVQVESHEEQPGDLFFEDKSADIKIAAEEEFSDTNSQKSAKDTDAEENENNSEISDDISAKISSDESDNEYVGSILRKTNDAQEFEGNSDQLKSSPPINGNKGNNEECILKDDEQQKHNKTVEAKEVKDQIGTTTKNGKQPTADASRDDESNLKKLKSGSRKRKIQPNIMLKDNMHQEESMQGQKRITRSYSLRNKRH